MFGFVYLQAIAVDEAAKDTRWMRSGADLTCNVLVAHVLIEILVLMASYYACESKSSTRRSRVSLIHSFELSATIAELVLVMIFAGVLVVSLTFEGRRSNSQG